MIKMLFCWLISAMTTVCVFAVPVPDGGAAESSFPAWKQEFRREARAAGITEKTLDRALGGLEKPLPRVIALDRRQPELVQTMKEYVETRVSRERIAGGRQMMDRYPTWLGRVERAYGVQRRFIVALWGMETNYGRLTGGFPVIHSLATLAYEGRRSTYFRKELLNALRILQAGHVSLKHMDGSWAGAMGQCQFMPSSFLRAAVDFDKDGRTDIWNSVPDVLASTANYLAQSGWRNDLTWGRPVQLPKKFDLKHVGLKIRWPLARWQALGVRRMDGGALPRRNVKASLIAPAGAAGPAYLVYDNFRVLLSWNRSTSFAVAVGLLSDRIAAPR
ncbi:MAG: lytic murein transglycosylase [Syntrophotaleaceae bacterium]